MKSMVETDMKRNIYTNKISVDISDEIISFENNILLLYRERIKKYMPLFKERGCSLKVGLMWKIFPNDTVLHQRACFKKGYESYVYCVVQKNGKDVHIVSNEYEIDYYDLSNAWMITNIRRFFKFNIELFTTVDDEVDTDLNKFLIQLNQSKDEEILLF